MSTASSRSYPQIVLSIISIIMTHTSRQVETIFAGARPMKIVLVPLLLMMLALTACNDSGQQPRSGGNTGYQPYPPSYPGSNDLCPKNVGASQPTPPGPYDTAFQRCAKDAHNNQIACDQNQCGQWRCGDQAATVRGNACLQQCARTYQGFMQQCSAMFGGRS